MHVASSPFITQAQNAYARASSQVQGGYVAQTRKTMGLRLGKLGIRIETEESLDQTRVAQEAESRLKRLRAFNFAELLQAQDARLSEAMQASQNVLALPASAPVMSNYTRHVGVRAYARAANMPTQTAPAMLHATA